MESTDLTVQQSTRWWKRYRWLSLAAVVCVIALYIGLILHAEYHAPIFSGDYLSWVDFDTHAQQVQRFTEALNGWGHIWGYDVQLLAGYPSGTIFEMDNHGWSLWTYGLWKLGLSHAVAYNLFVILVHCLVFPAIYVSARLFRLSWQLGIVAGMMGMSIWFFDGLMRWCWYSGGLAYCFNTLTVTVSLGLFYQYMRSRKARYLLFLGPLLAVQHTVHPSIFMMLFVPMGILFGYHWKSLLWKGRFAVFATGAFVLATNLWWLFVAFRFAHYVTDHEPFFLGTLKSLWFDLWGLVDNAERTGMIGNRVAFRFLSIFLGAIMIGVWVKERDDRGLCLASGGGFLLLVAYLGGYLWPVNQVQPYRFILPAALMGTVPAAAAAGEFVRRVSFRNKGAFYMATCAVILWFAVSYLAKDIIYFFPKSLPQVPRLQTREQAEITALGFPEYKDFRHYPPPEPLEVVARRVKEINETQGRYLVEWWVLGEYLLARTNAQVLGGFRQRNLKHRAANLFRKYSDGKVSRQELAQYLEKYAVRWVLVSAQMPELESSDLLELTERIDIHRLYRVRHPTSLIKQGGGKLDAALNSLRITGSEPLSDVVLRFHWLETLRCKPDCQLVREPDATDEVGFIRVSQPHPADFTIYNGY